MTILNEFYSKFILNSTLYTLIVEEIDGWVLYYDYWTVDCFWYLAHEDLILGVVEIIGTIIAAYLILEAYANYANYLHRYELKFGKAPKNTITSKTIFKFKVFFYYLISKKL